MDDKYSNRRRNVLLKGRRCMSLSDQLRETRVLNVVMADIISLILFAFLIVVRESISHTDPPLCSIRFENLYFENNFVIKSISNNTFYVKLINQNFSDNQANQSKNLNIPVADESNLKLKRYYQTQSKIPPVAIFDCVAPYFVKFEINSTEAVPFVEVERARQISRDYNPALHPDDYIHLLKVKVIMAANSTGEYVFHSKEKPQLKTSFFIFADTEDIQLLGIGRILKAIPVKNRNIRIPCVSPNPMQKMYLWKLNSTGGPYDEILVDNSTVFYNSGLGYLIMSNPNSTDKGISTYYRCSIDHFWYAQPFVDIDVSPGDLGNIHSNLSINLLKHGGGADCYGTSDADLKFYKINVNEDVAPLVVKCFEQRKSHCGLNPFHRDGDDVVMGSPANPDESRRLSTSMLRFDNDQQQYGLLVCTSNEGVVSMPFFKGLNRLYYSDVEKTPITSILRINIVPNPDTEPVIDGSVITISTNEVFGIFVYTPRIVYIKFRNRSLKEISRITGSEDGGYHTSFLVTSNVTGVIVNDQFKSCGRTISLLKSISVKQIQCEENEFKCGSGECISINRICDHRINCRDGKSDEMDCKEYSRNCTSDEFRCKSGQCISNTLHCSGIPDCFDESDESDCQVCAADQFLCQSGECVRLSDVCDADADCDDASDESLELCKDCNGNPEKFKCTKGGCILKERVCDGYSNCDDKSDEDPNICTSIIPIIVNDVDSYAYGTNEVDYLVCEVFIPPPFASQERYQPHVNWTFFPLNTSINEMDPLKKPEMNFRNQMKLEVIDQSKIKLKDINSTIYYFPYKFENFDESQVGTYICRAYNDAGSTSQRFEVSLKHCEDSNLSLPSAQEDRPMEGSMEEEPPQMDDFEFAPIVYECRTPGKYSDPDNCVQFHECVDNGFRLVHYKFDCGPGTVYCRDMQFCGWERDCPCENSQNENIFIESDLEEVKKKKQIPTKVVQIKGQSGKKQRIHKKVIFGG